MELQIQDKLDEIMKLIFPENDINNQFDDLVFDKVDELISLTGNDNIANTIYENSTKVDILKLSILFDILIWSTPDNGTELLNGTKKWFIGNDRNKIELVLNMTSVYPYQPFDFLEKRLDEIKIKFPEFQQRCDYWLVALSKLK